MSRDEHPLEGYRLPGLGPMRLARLEEAGVDSLEALAAVDPEALCTLPGFPRPVVDRLIEAASAALEHAPPPAATIIELDPSQRNLAPVSMNLRRGLEIARKVEETRGCVRRTRALLKAQIKQGPYAAHAVEARGAGKKLIKVLARVQREAITHGLSEGAAGDIDDLLTEIEARLERFGERKLTAKRIRKIHRRLDAMRRELRSRLT